MNTDKVGGKDVEFKRRKISIAQTDQEKRKVDGKVLVDDAGKSTGVGYYCLGTNQGFWPTHLSTGLALAPKGFAFEEDAQTFLQNILPLANYLEETYEGLTASYQQRNSNAEPLEKRLYQLMRDASGLTAITEQIHRDHQLEREQPDHPSIAGMRETLDALFELTTSDTVL